MGKHGSVAASDGRIEAAASAIFPRNKAICARAAELRFVVWSTWIQYCRANAKAPQLSHPPLNPPAKFAGENVDGLPLTIRI